MTSGQTTQYARAEGAGGRLPNLLIIGVGRAGTTSLFNYLGKHPEIGISVRSEILASNCPCRAGTGR